MEFRLGPGQEQQVVDEPAHLARQLDHPFQGLAIIHGLGGAAAQRDLGLPAQHGERRAQLMADIGQEEDAQAVQVLQAPVRLLELGRALADLELEQGLLVQELAALGLELPGHAVEVARQERQLVAALDRDPMGQLARADRLGPLGEPADRPRQRPAQERHGDGTCSDGGERGGNDDGDQLAGEGRGLVVGPAHLLPLVGDRKIDQLLELVVQVLLDLTEIAQPGLGIPTAELERQEAQRRLVHPGGDLPHPADQGELAALVGQLLGPALVLAEELHLACRDLHELGEAILQVPSRFLELLPPLLPEQQHLRDLLGVAVGVQGQRRDRLELAIGVRDPLDIVVRAPDGEVDHRPHQDHDPDQEDLEGDYLRLDLHDRLLPRVSAAGDGPCSLYQR